MIDMILLIALCVAALAGILLAVLQLPGTWLIFMASIGYDAWYGWQRIGWKWLVGLAALALAAEAVETLASVAAARRAGAGTRASIGALAGGLGGMILFSLPLPIIGTIAGGLIGCFVGALVGELSHRDDLAAGVRVGVFATIGRLLGLLVKTSAAFAVAGAAVSLAIRAM